MRKPKQPRTGKYHPQNPDKYAGNVNNIIYRSGLELKMMEIFDLQSHIIKWASEEIAIPYINPLDDVKRRRRYFVDFLVTAKQKDGTVQTFAIEIKPEAQTMPPQQPKRKTKRYLSEVSTWLTNQAKWKAAKAFCESKGWNFMIMTERQIYGDNKYKQYKKYKTYKK